MKLRWLLAVLIVALGAGQSLAAPETLSYVQSSNGLGTPALEGGNTELELADVNLDGHLDLVSIGDHGSPYINTDQHGVMVWFGDGAGNWSVFQYGNFGYGGIAVGDVNNDGLPDVGYGMHHNYSGVDLGDQILEVALGDGTGTSWTAWDDGLATNGEDWGMFNTDFADVDNDGDLDVGSSSFGCCAGVHVYLNQGDGTWTQSFGFLGGNPYFAFTFGDVNGDGLADFGVGHQYGTVFLGDGQGGFSLADGNLPPLVTNQRAGPDLGDVNGDGRDDLSFCNSQGGVEVWTWSGGTWQELSGTLPASGTCEATQIRDMDVDGHGDVAAFGYGTVRVWTGDGAGNWTLATTFTTPTPGYKEAFRAGGDADHNGYPDLALVSDEGSGFNYRNHLRFYKEASVPAALAVAPVRPRGGETLYAGSVRFLDWISAVPGNVASTVDVDLSVVGPGGPWQPVASGLPNNGRHQWLLPAGLPNTANAFLRYTVTTAGGTARAVTPAPFTVAGGLDLPRVHVQGIVLQGRTLPSAYAVKAAVILRDGADQPVSQAAVSLRLTAPGGGVRYRQALSGAQGIAQASWASLGGGTWQACVLNVEHPGYVYDPAQNHETCDSLVYP
jgi:hypothetical protein